MKKSMFYALSVAVLGTVLGCSVPAFAEEGAYPVTVKDDMGNEVTLEEAPESIVSLSPVNTEFLFALGVGDAVTGRTDYCNYPKEAADVDSVGTYTEPNMELILSKAPDLVLASDYIDDSVRQQLEDSGAAVFITSANDLDAIENDIETIGKLVGHEDEATDLKDTMNGELDELNVELEKVTEPKSAFVDLGSLYSAGPSSLLDNSLQMIKVTNVAADADSAWPQLSAEAVVEANPDVYISLFSKLDDVKEIAGLSDLACLNEENGFIYIDGSGEAGDMIQRPGPRYVEGLKTLAELVYPEIAEK